MANSPPPDGHGGAAADDGVADPAPGSSIDRFRLDELLHQGGMAQIWSVHDQGADAGPSLPLVMKLPRVRRGDDPAAIVGFEVEQMILPTLGGAHVPRFVARGDLSHQPYLVMERIAGDSLRGRLDAAPLPIDEVIEIGSRVATALHDIHRQHVVHLDVKPSNIMFRADGSAVLVDFGLSRHDHLPDLLDEQFTLPIGTGPYMSPEQVGFVRDDPRSDLFALGVMLYHFTTGARPFGAPDNVRGLRRRLWLEPVPPRLLRRDCPPWLQEVILHCLEVRPELRYQTAAQLALDLQSPSQIALGERAARQQRAGLAGRLGRWLAAHRVARPHVPRRASEQLARSPIVMAAVDVENASADLLEQLLDTVRRIVLTEPGARLACVSVMPVARIGMDDRVDTFGRSRHVKQLVALKHWARPIRQALQLDEARLTYHVLEAPGTAEAIIDFAQRNGVDHIVMGARASSGLRRYLGSVSSPVVAGAGCTVTVVRVAGGDQTASRSTSNSSVALGGITPPAPREP